MDNKELAKALRTRMFPEVKEMCMDDRFDCDEFCDGDRASCCVLLQAANALEHTSASEESYALACAQRDKAVDSLKNKCEYCRHLNDCKQSTVNHPPCWEWEGILTSQSTEETPSAKLIRLIAENPTLPIVPMVNYEVCADDCCAYWMGSFARCEVNEYVCAPRYGEEGIYFRNDDEGLVEGFYNDAEDGISDAEALVEAQKKVKALPWKKAIIVYINLPED